MKRLAFSILCFGLLGVFTPQISSRASASDTQKIERIVSKLLAAFHKDDYQGFRAISKALPVNFSQKDFHNLHLVLRSFGQLKRVERGHKKFDKKDIKGSIYRLFYSSGKKFFLAVGFREGELVQFKFVGKEITQRAAAIEEEANKKLSITDFHVLNSAGFPHLSSGPLPPGLVRYRLSIRGLKKKDGSLLARMKLFLRVNNGLPKPIIKGKQQRIQAPPTIVHPVWSVKGGLRLQKEARYTLIFEVTDINTQEKVIFETTLNIKAP